MAVVYRAPTRQEMKEIRAILWSLEPRTTHNLLVATGLKNGEPVLSLEHTDFYAFWADIKRAKTQFDEYREKRHIDIGLIPFTKEENVIWRNYFTTGY